MSIPANVIVNADDLGLNHSLNKAILCCFEHRYINSTSLLTNTDYFEETVHLLYENPVISNIGVHINFAEGKPVTNFKEYFYLDGNGEWDINKSGNKFNILTKAAKEAFSTELSAQIDRALEKRIAITHLDSHYNLHALPCYYVLFLKAAKHYKLKLRLAQTDYKKKFLKFVYHRFVNNRYKAAGANYSDYFTDVHYFLKHKMPAEKITEIMLHPSFDNAGKLTDHYDAAAMAEWTDYLDKLK